MVNSALTVSITVADLDRGQLEQLFRLLGDTLMERRGPESSLLDHSVSIDLSTGVIEISVTTTARSQLEGEVLAEYYVKDVLASAGGIYSHEADLNRHNAAPTAAEFAMAVTGRQLASV